MTPCDRTDPAFVLAERIAGATGFGFDGEVHRWLFSSAERDTNYSGWVHLSQFLETDETLLAVIVQGGSFITFTDLSDEVFIVGQNALRPRLWWNSDTLGLTKIDRDICRTIDAATDGMLYAGLVNSGDERALRWYRGEELSG